MDDHLLREGSISLYWTIEKIYKSRDRFQKYITVMNGFLKSQIEEGETKVRELETKLAEEQDPYEIYVGGYDWETYQHLIVESEEFRQTLLRSIFISLYSHMERTMFDLCNDLVEGMKDSFSPKPPDKSYIDDTKEYLKVLGIAHDYGSDANWGKIKKYQKLRNKFVHSNMRLRDDEAYAKEIKEFIKGSKYLLLDEEQKIVVLDGFCQEAINVVHQFLTSITNSAREWYQSQPIGRCKTIDMDALSKKIHKGDTEEQPDPWYGEYPLDKTER